MSDSLHSSTGDGILTGVTSAQTPEQIRAAQAAINGLLPNTASIGWQQQVPMQPQPQGQTFTAEDIEKARQEEKAKLYQQLQQIEEVRGELNALKAEREAAQKAAEEAEAARLEAERKAEEEKMDVRQLLQRTQEDFNQRFAEAERERARVEALLEKEREFSALQEYRQQKLAQEQENIIPPLLRYVQGDTVEEIDASIEEAKRNSQEILQGVAQAQQQAWSGMRGTAPTAPVGGPLENVPMDKPITDADIRNMSMAEYARNRGRLLPAASRQFYGQRG